MDYDNDGRIDILTGSISGKVHLFKRKPNGAYAEGETIKKEVSSLVRGLGPSLNLGSGSTVCMADWNGDGKLDLFVGNSEGEVYVLLNEGTPKKPAFAKAEKLKAAGKTIAANGGVAGPFVVDWDGDGKLDLLLGSSSGAVTFYRNTGSKTKAELATGVNLIEPLPTGWDKDKSVFKNPKRSLGSSKVCAVDWNGDGKLDLVVGDSSYERQEQVYKSHGWVWVYLRKSDQVAAEK